MLGQLGVGDVQTRKIPTQVIIPCEEDNERNSKIQGEIKNQQEVPQSASTRMKIKRIACGWQFSAALTGIKRIWLLRWFV